MPVAAMPLKKSKQAALDRWKAQRQAEAPPEPPVEMEVELEEPTSDGPETFEARNARLNKEYLDECNMITKWEVFCYWSRMRQDRMEDEALAKARAEEEAAEERKWEHTRQLCNRIFELELQLKQLEVHTGVRRAGVNRADWPAWATSVMLPCCDCAQECVGECIAKYLDRPEGAKYLTWTY